MSAVIKLLLSLLTILAPPPSLPLNSSSFEVVDHGSRQVKNIALTFDADMTPAMRKRLLSGQIKTWYNAKIIQTLEETHTQATLFLTGMWIELYPQVTQELAQNPLFELGNHSYSHPAFASPCFGLQPIDNKDDWAQITKTQTLLQNAGVNNRWFRFPGGCHDTQDLKTLQELKLVPIGWDVDGPDAFNTNTPAIVQNILRHTQNGSIIVLHLHGGPNAPKTDQVLPEIIAKLKAKGFNFVKISTLLNQP